MSFLDVYMALVDQIENDPVLLSYMSASDFKKGFKEVLPQRKYMVIVEPGTETEPQGKDAYNQFGEAEYEIQVYCRMVLTLPNVESMIVGSSTVKGLLNFTDDVKQSIRKNRYLGYNKSGTSISGENVSGTFDLTSSAQHIKVSLNGRTPNGYDEIYCGGSSLSGAEVATNIQASLRALGKHADDGYTGAICTFNETDNTFTIASPTEGPTSTVEVSAASTLDCSSLLGFDNPTEERGTKITKMKFGQVSVDNRAWPVRYRIIPVTITEEVLKGGF